jgi:hypothetical protein
VLSFDNKKSFNHRDNRGEILKIPREYLFMGNPLLLHVDGPMKITYERHSDEGSNYAYIKEVNDINLVERKTPNVKNIKRKNIESAIDTASVHPFISTV